MYDLEEPHGECEPSNLNLKLVIYTRQRNTKNDPSIEREANIKGSPDFPLPRPGHPDSAPGPASCSSFSVKKTPSLPGVSISTFFNPT
jgi:hypothetical protein